MLQSDGGRCGDGIGDVCVSQSQYEKAARQVSAGSHAVFHGGVEQTVKQLRRLIAVDVEERRVFDQVPRSTVTARRQRHLKYKDNSNAESRLVVARWRLHYPWLALAGLLACDQEDQDLM